MNKTFVGMNIYTEFGDFVRFKDVATFMSGGVQNLLRTQRLRKMRSGRS